MSEESIDLIIREAIPDDAAALLRFMKETAEQTDFLTLETENREITVEEEAQYLANLFDSANNCLMVALDGDRMIGAASVHASGETKTRHIGDIGIVVHQDYWEIGLGTILMEELIFWANEMSVLKRLQLEVQERNVRARKLYEKFGFQTEAVMERGLYVNEKYLSVCLMSLLIGEV